MILLSCDQDDNIREIECNVAKNKDGETGHVWMQLMASEFRMEQAEHRDRSKSVKKKSKFDDSGMPPMEGNETY